MVNKYVWAIVSDIDCDWKNTKKQAIKRAKELAESGADYCYIEKFDEEQTTGEIEYIKPKRK